jgi:hypothetical protein
MGRMEQFACSRHALSMQAVTTAAGRIEIRAFHSGWGTGYNSTKIRDFRAVEDDHGWLAGVFMRRMMWSLLAFDYSYTDSHGMNI